MANADNAQAKPKIDAQDFSRSLLQINEKSQRIIQDFIARHHDDPPFAMHDFMSLSKAFQELSQRMWAEPAKLIEAQMAFWQDYMRLWTQTTAQMMGGERSEPMISPEKSDKRFKHEDWDTHPVFSFLKQAYLLTARHVHTAVRKVEGMDNKTAKQVDFYTRQFMDALSPSNFVMTNPEVLRATVDSNGENLLKGLNNLLDDLERGKGVLSIKMTDLDAFELGRNVAVTPGKVVFQNDLTQLIQYSPTTEHVHKRPLLIIPPWINKYYILDLRPENSLIKWAVDQGHTVFCISWVNPTNHHKDKGFDHYMTEGPLAALDAMKAATGVDEANVIGYCLGGTLLASTLAYMGAKGDTRIKGATFMTTLLDFAEPGELEVFIDEEQIRGLEHKMKKHGFLDGRKMAGTFSMLRSNDLIWSYFINNYLHGKEPFPFDLLYWNSDSTNMPAKMHSFYLRNMYQKNLLIKPGGIHLLDEAIDLRQIKTPSYFISTIEDHIAPWKATYSGARLFAGPVRFVLGGSGHIAGVINPPAKNKYGHWTNETLTGTPEQWQEAATQQEGSWWTDWDKWICKLNGSKKVPARQPGDAGLAIIEDAPGSYVKVRVG